MHGAMQKGTEKPVTPAGKVDGAGKKETDKLMTPAGKGMWRIS